VNTDREAGVWQDLQELQDPLGPYSRMYRAKVIAQNDDTDELDLRPDNPLLPDMAKIPLRHGFPGLRVSVARGSYVLVGWDDGRPDRPFAGLWTPGTKVTKVSIVADRINVGSRDAHEAMVLGTSYRAAEDQMLQGLQQALTMLAAACTAGPLAALQAGMQRALLEVTKFIAAAAAARGYLSQKDFGE
jgi:hypothetical protein